MDELTLEVEQVELRSRSTEAGEIDRGSHARLRVIVNGRGLREQVRDSEQAGAPPGSGPFGAYAYVASYEFPDGLFDGTPADRQLRFGDRVALMGCDCGEIGCWPLIVRITDEGATVRWDDFAQPHRPGWIIEGSFVFDAVAYRTEVAAAEKRFARIAHQPDEYIAAVAAGVRDQIEIVVEVCDGVLLAWHRRDELVRRSADELSWLRTDPEAREEAIADVKQRLGVSHRQAMAIARRDIHGLSAAEIRAQERLRDDMHALRGADDRTIREQYNAAVERSQA